jgi:oxygen-dependent protoporphyrinogen oxidase
MAEKVHRVAVVGGGISGLAACRFVQRRLQDTSGSKRVVLIEQGQRLGGWLHSLRTPEGFVFEAGPSRSVSPPLLFLFLFLFTNN